MIAFLTSSPCIYGAPRAILNPENNFIENLFSCLPEHPRCLFICSSPDRRDLTARFGADIFSAFAEISVNRHRKAGNCNAAACSAQLRVAGHATHNSDVV